ncbi:hypothetical protein ADK67_38440 [Saccharothrix sp. NRRL B-16348]|nr:hypothetical protein ADK67_38440 [Saccharothrix sp. NRRL B-16348]
MIEHQGARPAVDPTAYVAPTAVICGDVTIGPRTHVSYGAVIEAHGSPVSIGTQCVIRENLNIRSTGRDAVTIGDHVLVGPHASLKGCTVEDESFLATGVRVYQGARIGERTEVRIDGVVHVASVLPPRSLVPIKWVAVGDPARILPPDKHDEIDEILARMDFAHHVYGIGRLPGADHRADQEL